MPTNPSRPPTRHPRVRCAGPVLVAALIAGCGGGGETAPAKFSIGGTVMGLTGSGLVLQNNGGDSLAVGANGSFTFATSITSGNAYSVTVLAQPTNPSQNCAVSNAAAMATADVTNVVVTCTTTPPDLASAITFEELPNGLTAMANRPGSAVPTGSRLTNQYLASRGVSFTAPGGFAALVNHGPGNPTASIPNVIGGSTADGRLDYNAPITIAFFDVANTSRKAVTDSFKIQGDWFPLGSGQVFATAYDAAGNVLGSTSDTDNKVFGVSGAVLKFNVAGIHSVVISGDNGTVGFDQLEYGELTAIP